MAKKRTRFDYTSLAEVLSQQGVAEADILNAALKASAAAGIPFPEILLTQDLITDWELSRQVCKLYGLPFLPVDIYPPSEEAVKLVPHDFIRQHRLIPIGVHGSMMTVCMPALVPAEVLGEVSVMTDMHIQAMVGTVQSNGRWILSNLPDNVPTALPDDFKATEDSGGWGNLFDEGDASVLMDLGDELAVDAASVEVASNLEELQELESLDEAMVLSDEGDDAADDGVSDIPPLPEIG